MRCILVGGSRGLGKALKSQLEAGGHTVVALNRSNGSLDLSKDSCSAIVRKATQNTPTDCLILSSGLALETQISVPDSGMAERMMRVNFWGPRACIKGFLRAALKARGKICVVSSTVVRPPSARWLADYAASKAALEALVTAWSPMLARHGVSMFTVRPGWFTAADGAMTANLPPATLSKINRGTPMGMGSATEVASFIANLLESPNWTTAGRTFECSGGL